MNILEAYDLTGSLRDAAELAGCPSTLVARYVAAREQGRVGVRGASAATYSAGSREGTSEGERGRAEIPRRFGSGVGDADHPGRRAIRGRTLSPIFAAHIELTGAGYRVTAIGGPALPRAVVRSGCVGVVFGALVRDLLPRLS